MTDYNDGKWHGWNGGECPVHPESEIEGMEWYRLSWSVPAKDCDWGSFKGAFRVVKQHREPREWWIWTDSRGVVHALDFSHPGSVRVREVLE